MTPRQLRLRLRRLALSRRRFANTIGVDWRTIGRWLAGDHRVPTIVAVLLDVWTAHPNLIPQSRTPAPRRGRGRR